MRSTVCPNEIVKSHLITNLPSSKMTQENRFEIIVNSQLQAFAFICNDAVHTKFRAFNCPTCFDAKYYCSKVAGVPQHDLILT